MSVSASLHSFLKLALLSLFLVTTANAAVTPIAEGSSSIEISATSSGASTTASVVSATISETSSTTSTTSTAPSSSADSSIEIDITLNSGGLKPVCKGKLPRQGTAKPEEPFWLEAIKHQGKAPYNPDPNGYKVFRNVKDFGAVGDGVHDDTAAINAAISSGNRCGEGCQASTISPAVVYFPKGTYLVSQPLLAYYYTQFIGDAKNLPVILAAPTFDFSGTTVPGGAVFDADPYIPNGNGAQWYINQNNFFRSIRNVVIDLRQVPSSTEATGIHWQLSQATSLANVVIEMSTAPDTRHRGIFMENGSGGYMGDLVLNGGQYGLSVGNQQFSVKNLTVSNARVGIFSIWNWGWTYQGVNIRNCAVGFEVNNPGAGSNAIIDAFVVDTPIFVRMAQAAGNGTTGNLILNNARLKNSPIAVAVNNGPTLLEGGTKTIPSWGQGNVYRGDNSQGQFTTGDFPAPHKASSLLDSAGRIVARQQPQYENYRVSDFISVKDYGAKGDGKTDDTKILQKIFKEFADCKIIFFDAGHYIVTDTVYIPAGTRMVGEAWSVLSGKGPKFADQKRPRVIFQVGKEGERGIVEISDIVFSTVGPQVAGAIVVEWNIHEPSNVKAGAGMWNSHIRTGGAAGTNLLVEQCPTSSTDNFSNCFAAFLSLHITKGASGYFEATWVWLADHQLDVDGLTQISIYSGRGILSESQGPVWLVGTGSEHHAVYQYRFNGAKDHYMGLIQTESPYYQPTPSAPTPFAYNPRYDIKPYASDAPSAWAVSIEKSRNILIFGAGLYSFFRSYSTGCTGTRSCQAQIANIDKASKGINIFSLSTVSSTEMVSINAQGVVHDADNLNGFVSTIASWSSE